MWINRKEIEGLSEFIKESDEGAVREIRDNKEGPLSILKNDIYTLVESKNEQLKNAYIQRDVLADYMSDISHQLKTPITSMEMMLDLMEDAPPEKKEEFRRNIKFSLHKMEWLLGALLKMAKIDADAVTFNKKSVPVSELIEMVRPSVDVLLDINDQTIEQTNAIEHSPKTGVITIDCGDNPLYEWVSIKDSGSGMDKMSYSALFKRFEYSTNENGFGIGMPLALTIVKGQGGDIDVDFGGNGQGATFIIKMYK